MNPLAEPLTRLDCDPFPLHKGGVGLGFYHQVISPRWYGVDLKGLAIRDLKLTHQVALFLELEDCSLYPCGLI
jgi:hypothetical protein